MFEDKYMEPRERNDFKLTQGNKLHRGQEKRECEVIGKEVKME